MICVRNNNCRDAKYFWNRLLGLYCFSSEIKNMMEIKFTVERLAGLCTVCTLLTPTLQIYDLISKYWKMCRIKMSHYLLLWGKGRDENTKEMKVLGSTLPCTFSYRGSYNTCPRSCYDLHVSIGQGICDSL